MRPPPVSVRGPTRPGQYDPRVAPRHARTQPVTAVSSRARGLATLAAMGVLGAVILVAGLLPNTVIEPAAAAATHGPLRVASISPTGSDVAPDAVLEVRFNNPIATTSPMPTVAPHVAGSWARLSPSALVFQPAASLLPGTHYVVRVPATTTATDGARLGRDVAHPFVVALGSVLRLNQVLAQLGYLPLRFVPTGPFDADSSAVQRGIFAWRFPKVPVQLTSLWEPDQFNVITEGALMRFEDATGIGAQEALPTAPVWRALLRDVALHNVDQGTYNYVLVSTAIPETLTLYVNMHPIYQSLVNTGISARPTALATHPVYLRYTVTTMSGTNPDGTVYHDPGIPWVSYFFGGEALHGFIRSSYGWPQSLGCVEMPFANAAVVWPHTPIGTLVTVY